MAGVAGMFKGNDGSPHRAGTLDRCPRKVFTAPCGRHPADRNITWSGAVPYNLMKRQVRTAEWDRT
jgi:hypothetical protein